jgi:formyl-CoA transferase
VTLDLKSAEGKERALKLARGATRWWRTSAPASSSASASAGSAARREPAPRHRPHQRLRPGRPYRDKPAFGAIGEAMGGLRHLTANPARPTSAAALRRVHLRRPRRHVRGHGGRRRVLGPRPPGGDGQGRVIDVDLVSSVFSLMEGMLPEYGMFGWVRQPQAPPSPPPRRPTPTPAPTASGSASPATPTSSSAA